MRARHPAYFPRDLEIRRPTWQTNRSALPCRGLMLHASTDSRVLARLDRATRELAPLSQVEERTSSAPTSRPVAMTDHLTRAPLPKRR